jgi:hypothetical protein
MFAVSGDVYRKAFHYIARTYFTQPNYYKAPTLLPNGSTADCCFFSFYQPEYIADGNNTEAVELMDEFRKEAEAVGTYMYMQLYTGTGLIV